MSQSLTQKLQNESKPSIANAQTGLEEALLPLPIKESAFEKLQADTWMSKMNNVLKCELPSENV